MRLRVLVAKNWLFEPYGACSLLVLTWMHQLETLLIVRHENQWEDSLLQGSPELFSPSVKRRALGSRLQNHPKSQQRERTCAVIEKPVFRASLALSMLEIELYQISLPYDRGRSGYKIRRYPENPAIWLVAGAGSIFLSPDHGHGNQLR